MKRIFIFFLGIFLITAECGCFINHKVSGEPGKCELHGRILHKSIVRVKYGAYCAPGTHLGKGSENFPNAKHTICGGCVVRSKFRFIYNCSECNRAKRRCFLSNERNADANIRSKF